MKAHAGGDNAYNSVYKAACLHKADAHTVDGTAAKHTEASSSSEPQQSSKRSVLAAVAALAVAGKTHSLMLVQSFSMVTPAEELHAAGLVPCDHVQSSAQALGFQKVWPCILAMHIQPAIVHTDGGLTCCCRTCAARGS